MCKEEAVAVGYPTTSTLRPRFMVKAGSTAMVNGSPAVKRNPERRDDLVKKGILAVHPSNPNLFVFQRDYEFSSASAAGDIIIDGSSSAPQSWKNIRTGRSLRDDLR
jgi:hypothetical protein